MGRKTESSINLPQGITLEIITNTPVTSNNLTRSLIFKNFEDKELELKFTLNVVNGFNNKLVITDFPETLHTLQVLGSMNHRSFWDRIYLKNAGGSTALDIHKISLTVHYVKGVSGAERDVPMLDNFELNQVLAQGDEIYLTNHIETSMIGWAGLNTANSHSIAVEAARDLGKSGTSAVGFDEHGNNPKYRGWLSYECSEFVSWYIHDAYSNSSNYNGFPNNCFKNITFTGQIHEKFHDLNKTYYYNNSRQGFYAEFNDSLTYSPKAGDILIRRGNGNFEHSMILVDWNSTSKIATVIDGPYLITLREVDIQGLESRDTNEKDFILCSV